MYFHFPEESQARQIHTGLKTTDAAAGGNNYNYGTSRHKTNPDQIKKGVITLIISTLCGLYPVVRVTWYNLTSEGRHRRLRLPPPRENIMLIAAHHRGNREPYCS